MENLYIKILLTGLSYMIYPFLKFKVFKTKDFSKEQIKKICIINSTIIMIIFIILGYYFNPSYKINPSPAVIFFFINNTIFSKNNNIIKKKRKKDGKKKEKKVITLQNDNLYTNFIGEKKSKKYNTLFCLVIIVLFISLLFNIIQYNNYTKLNDAYTFESANNDMLQSKVNFLNENIVFILKGDNTYYYDYDCLKQITNEKNYQYLAYNKEQAISKGYQPYKCESKIKTLK